MRLVPSSDTVPASVNRYLLPFERQVISIHFHGAVLIIPLALGVGALTAAAVVSTAGNLSSDARLTAWLVAGLLMVYAAWRVLRWSIDYYVVTPQRMLVISGIFARDVAMLPLGFAVQLRLRRSFLGRILGYGHFILEPGGRHQAVRRISYLPYPEQLYLEVCGLLFRDLAEDD
jgi:hypothetical protein